MTSELNTTEQMEMKVFPKGQVVIPVMLRKKYNIDIGDNIQVIPAENGILLKPKPKTKKPESITDNLFGIFKNYARNNKKIDKKDILNATENGFIEGWEK
ncbi:MAG: AbrB/MazE/SpoVT family DNA-binding domain-containing protein [Deltaproteobacteria bacterium]|nr:AbrB/MazE/SpoVT family DNA-binding domain-containing protein [Deltaproteobacteria bacterium]